MRGESSKSEVAGNKHHQLLSTDKQLIREGMRTQIESEAQAGCWEKGSERCREWSACEWARRNEVPGHSYSFGIITHQGAQREESAAHAMWN